MRNPLPSNPVLCSLALFALLAAFACILRPGSVQAGYAVLTSQHKFAPQEAAQSRSRSNLVNLRRDQESKSRPEITAETLSRGRLPSKITSRSAIVLDAATGETLYARSPDLAGQPASTIKVLTGMLAITTLKNREKVTVSRRAAGMPRSKVYLRAGRSYAADDLINAVLLASANDASVALAEKVGGSETVFASLMTHKARELGARNTVCKTASGLTARGQKTTARDLAVVFNEVMKNREFAERIRKIKVKTSFGKVLRNHNRALWQVSGAEGGKTGYTRLARQTYVGKFRRGQSELLVAIMGSETMWQDISTLVEYGFSRQEKLAAMRPGCQEQFPSRIVQLEQVGKRNAYPLLTVLAESRKVSRL